MDTMYRASIPYERRGAAIEVISAIGVSLCDVLGKLTGLPVYNLLGGKGCIPLVKKDIQNKHGIITWEALINSSSCLDGWNSHPAASRNLEIAALLLQFRSLLSANPSHQSGIPH